MTPKNDVVSKFDLFIKNYIFTVNDIEGEIWCDVIGFEESYQVSNYGRIKSLKNKTPKILKPMLNHKGYLKVDLRKNNHHSLFYIHRLVAKAFIPQTHDKQQVNHIDGNKFNNHYTNLEWVTPSENMYHSYRIGKHIAPANLKPPVRYGENNNCAKLTVSQVKQIRDLYASGEYSQRKLAKLFNVNKSTIKRIVLRETWAGI